MNIDMIEKEWYEELKEEFTKEYFKTLQEYIEQEYRQFQVYPPKEEIFSAFNDTPLSKVKIVILGQDPYHNKGQAHGLSFSVKPEVALPPSLVNIYKELKDDMECEIPKSGYLGNWAKQGVFMLNTVLTVRANEANSHQKKGWEEFTNAVIKLLDKQERPIVFILWGKPAQSKRKMLHNNKHYILEAPHPSPLSSYRGFFGSKPFSKSNQFLTDNGIEPINWQI